MSASTTMPTRLTSIRGRLLICFSLGLLVVTDVRSVAASWPELPQRDQRVQLPAQAWPLRPGNRTIEVLVHYPGGKLANVTKSTGIMLSLHNWGGRDCAGSASPTALTEGFDVVSLCVNYLQSGPTDSIKGPEPYDFGYLQALDALRALYWVYNGLQTKQIGFASDRLFATGGSGGGNVALMAMKLAPRTFTAVVDMCGMKKLSDDIAFNIPGGSDLNARYRREPDHPFALSRDHQELRWLGNPSHLRIIADLRSSTRLISIHGVDDRTCPFSDAAEFFANARAARLDIRAFPIREQDLGGAAFTSSGHALGDRTRIVFKIAGPWLDPAAATALRRAGATDFDLKQEVTYPTGNGAFVVSYRDGFPVGRFEPSAPAPQYSDHDDLTYYWDSRQRYRIESPRQWETRKRHLQDHLQSVMGQLPGPLQRVPLDVQTTEEAKVGKVRRRKLTYQSDPAGRVPAYLFIPRHKPGARLPAVLCLQQTTKAGKNEPAGLAGDPSMHYALQLAQRGYVTIAPDYPSFGEHRYEFGLKTGYASGSMKAIWDNIRAVDLLQSLPMVDDERIGCIGHSLGGHSTMFTAVFEPRLKVLVSNCGFSSFAKDDLPSWTGPRYMPRIAGVYNNDPQKVPFDFPEIIGSFAPRPFLISAAEEDNDFELSGVRGCAKAARTVYDLYDASAALEEHYFRGPHAFPKAARERAYAFLDRHLAHTGATARRARARQADPAIDRDNPRVSR